MQKVIIDKDKCESFKTFYEIVYRELQGKTYIDWAEYENLNYFADMLNEFLWYVHNEQDTEFVMVNFDLDKIKNQKTYDNYEWEIILKVLHRFVTEYPSNKLTFVN